MSTPGEKNKKITLLIFMLLLGSAGVMAADSINIIEPSVELTANHGSTLLGSFTIANDGDSVLDVNFSGLTLTKGTKSLTITGAESIIAMQNGTSESVSFSVTIPAMQEAGQYTGTLTASAGSAADTVDITVNVNADPSIQITPSPIEFGVMIAGYEYSESFTIINNGNVALTNLGLRASAASMYGVAFNKTAFPALAPGEAADIKAEIKIPINHSTGQTTLGTVHVSSDQKNASAPLRGSVDKKLVITEVRIKVGKMNWETVTHGSTASSKARLEDTVEVQVRVKNRNRFADEIIDKAEVMIIARELDDGDDYEDFSDDFYLDGNEERIFRFNFKIPLEFSENKVEMLIETDGRDENKTVHFDSLEFSIPVDRSRSIMIRSVELLPATVRCGQTAELYLELVNIGNRDENNCLLTVKSTGLNIDIREEFSLSNDIYDDDSRFIARYPISVAESVKAGAQHIEVRVYYDYNELSNFAAISLQVESCSAQPSDEQKTDTKDTAPKEAEDAEAEEGTGSSNESEHTVSIPVTKEGVPVLSFPDKSRDLVISDGLSTGLTTVLVLLNVAILSVIAYFLFVTVKKK